MSNFRFNFSMENDDIRSGNCLRDTVEWMNSEEITDLKYFKNIDSVAHAHMFVCGDLEIGHVIPNDVIKQFAVTDDVSRADQQHSDLVVGKYEGGLKIWECTADLMEYLLENIDKNKWRDSCVLDLGCGAGLLGIMAFMNGAQVVFQDYNKEVLESVTIPNCLLNVEDEKEKAISTCRYFSGDWASFDSLLEQSTKFDFILTSETIYNANNHSKIVNLLKRRLKPEGIAFVAAKTHYFGVGGGTRQFENAVTNAGLKTEVCWKSNGGIQREILKITL